MGSRGFTLVEVMVALAIVAITLPALLISLSRQADDTAYLRDKTLAQMVAANRLAETRLVVNASRQLRPGKDSGVAALAERDWFWWSETQPAPGVPNFFRVEIRVAADQERADQPMYTLVAFMSGDLRIEVEAEPEDAGGGDNSGGGDPLDPGGQIQSQIEPPVGIDGI